MDFAILAPTSNFILKPLAFVLSLIISVVYQLIHMITVDHSLGITIILFTFIVRACMLPLMLKQQPVASDLRHISTALKVVTDLERMGDQAADIADLSLRLEDADISLVSKHLPAMVANVKTMVKDAIHAFTQRDTETAETFEQRDDLIDAFFERVKREVIEFLKKDGDKSDVAVDLLMVAKYLERIADHAVNVCEWTEFSDTGAVGDVMIL